MVVTVEALFTIVQDLFILPREMVAPIVEGFLEEFKVGLRTPSKGLATMIPSFVTRMPTGNETGTFMSLDLGGTNLRIAAVQLLGDGHVKVSEVKHAITPELRVGTGVAFFDWIADAVQELVLEKARHLFKPDQVSGKETLYLGVCWSFPVDQTAVNHGTILRMGKGIALSDTEGRDLTDMFHEAFDRKGLNVKVNAILNDTVGALVAHAYASPRTRVGFIFATGCNAAYPEKVENIVKLDASVRGQYPAGTEMLLNTEIDIFGNESYLPLNRYDLMLDASHNQPKFQLFEKMMSGAYLGELTRLVALDFIEAGLLFHGDIPKGFEQPWSFPTKYMSALERDATEERHKSLETMMSTYEFDTNPTLEDVSLMTRICRIVSTRSAILCAAAIVALIEQQDLINMSENDIIIGMNGSTYEYYPFMEERVHRALRTWYGYEVSDRIRLEVTHEGGSVGGALIAMLCT
ncbi:actin-like ATPase domain-containing protein [Hesseltinella vesiculosa]|uniref:Phosphotransferase n=1 Tax=Hesseltinella vesiculosa TaxID=101127 RepID=A0A1X2GES4_9FUNG|nr:actin-like ATPase domain-containing protein [Hesseltinella vesiculosa]